MRFITTLFLTLMLTACAATPSQVPMSPEEQAAEAEQLVRYSLSERILESLEKNFSDQLTSFLMAKGVPAEMAQQMVAEELHLVIEDEHQRLLDALVPIYQRYYTADEIHQLLSFYQTDVARKSLKVSSQIAAEGQQYVRLWNENFEEVLMERIEKRLSESGISIDQ